MNYRIEQEAHMIQVRADHGLTPEQLQRREGYRQRIMDIIARKAIAPCMKEKPVNVGMDDEVIS